MTVSLPHDFGPVNNWSGLLLLEVMPALGKKRQQLSGISNPETVLAEQLLGWV